MKFIGLIRTQRHLQPQLLCAFADLAGKVIESKLPIGLALSSKAVLLNAEFSLHCGLLQLNISMRTALEILVA